MLDQITSNKQNPALQQWKHISEMAAMPFPCNGLCFFVFNIPTVLLMFLIIWLVVLSLIFINKIVYEKDK